MLRNSLRCIAGRRQPHCLCATATPRRSTSTYSTLEGRVDTRREAVLHDGTAASVGDTVITRRNDRRLRTGRRWVRNGDRWTVAGVRRDGGLEVHRPERSSKATVVLPGEYVRRQVELGYAVTAHRAQGITTDTFHVLVASGTTRENLYVAMTRGRESNVAYVAVDRPDVSHVGPRPGDAEKPTARSVLYGVLQHVGAESSAHETLAAEQDEWGSIAQLAAEYETIAAAAQHERWAELVRGCGLHPDQAEAAIESNAFGPLTAELRRAEAVRVDVEQLLSATVRGRGLDGAQDVAAVLRTRVAAASAHTMGVHAGSSRRAPRLIAGLIPEAVGVMDADARRALEERRALIEARERDPRSSAVREGAMDSWSRRAPPRSGEVVAPSCPHGCRLPRSIRPHGYTRVGAGTAKRRAAGGRRQGTARTRHRPATRGPGAGHRRAPTERARGRSKPQPTISAVSQPFTGAHAPRNSPKCETQ